MIISNRKVRVTLYLINGLALFILCMWIFVYTPLSMSQKDVTGTPIEILIAVLFNELLWWWITAAIFLPLSVGLGTQASYIKTCLIPPSLHVLFTLIQQMQAFMDIGVNTLYSFLMAIISTSLFALIIALSVIFPSYLSWKVGNKIQKILKVHYT